MLVLRLNNKEKLEYYRISEHDASVSHKTISDLSQLPKCRKQEQCVVLISGVEVLTKQIHLPKINKKHFSKAIPYALESTVIDDINSLKIIYGERDEKGDIPTAVMNKVLFDGYQMQFAKNHIQTDSVIPEYLFAPYYEACWTVWVDGSNAHVRISQAQGFSCDMNELLALLSLRIQAAGLNKPQGVIIVNHSSPDELSKSWPDALPDLQFKTLDMAQLAQLFDNNMFSLFSIKKKHRNLDKSLKRYCTALTVSIGIFLVINLFSFFHNYFYYNKYNSQLVNKVTEIYHSIYPSRSVSENPIIQMQKTLTDLEDNGKGDTFLNVLNEVGFVLQQLPEIRLQALSFNAGKLSLSLQTNKMLFLNMLISDLKEKGVVVNQNAMNMIGNQVNAKLVIG